MFHYHIACSKQIFSLFSLFQQRCSECKRVIYNFYSMKANYHACDFPDCDKRYLNQSSLIRHRKDKHLAKMPNQQIEAYQQNKKQQRSKKIKKSLSQKILKNDIKFYEKEVEINNLSELTLIVNLQTLLLQVFPKQKKLTYEFLGDYGNFTKRYRDIGLFALASKQHEYCLQEVTKLARRQGLLKIVQLTEDMQVCKTHKIYNSTVNMIWDLVKNLRLEIGKIVYLDLLCIVAQKIKIDQLSQEIKCKIQKFRNKVYQPSCAKVTQDLQLKLSEYVEEWTRVFQKEDSPNLISLRKNLKRPKKQGHSTPKID